MRYFAKEQQSPQAWGVAGSSPRSGQAGWDVLACTGSSKPHFLKLRALPSNDISEAN